MSRPGLAPWLERVLRTLPAVLYLAFTWSASADPAPSLPANVSDKLAHFGEYALLALLVLFALTAFDADRVSTAALAAAVAIGVVWGATDELHQAFVPTRDSSVRDLLADAAGSAAGAALVAALAWRERRRR